MVNVKISNIYLINVNLFCLVGGSRILSTSVVFTVVIPIALTMVAEDSALHGPGARSNE